MANWFTNQRRLNLLGEDPINNISDSPAKNLNKGYGAEVESGGPPMISKGPRDKSANYHKHPHKQGASDELSSNEKKSFSSGQGDNRATKKFETNSGQVSGHRSIIDDKAFSNNTLSGGNTLGRTNAAYNDPGQKDSSGSYSRLPGTFNTEYTDTFIQGGAGSYTDKDGMEKGLGTTHAERFTTTGRVMNQKTLATRKRYGEGGNDANTYSGMSVSGTEEKSLPTLAPIHGVQDIIIRDKDSQVQKIKKGVMKPTFDEKGVAPVAEINAEDVTKGLKASKKKKESEITTTALSTP
tara:strand:- start:95 stop:979 length:885 start_codon:yes stop_codon:yes gene_type:complete